VDRLRDTYHCAIVLVHHARKNESGPMQTMGLGSVNFSGWGDVLVYTNNKRKDGNVTFADLEMEGKGLTESKLEIVVDTEADPVVSIRQKGGGAFELVKRLITEKPGINQKELMKKSRMDYKKLRKILDKGMEEGYWAEKQGKGEGHSLGYYPEHFKISSEISG